MGRIKYFNKTTGQWEYADNVVLAGGGGGGGSNVQGDWNVNDPSDPAYVKNRTHYSNKTNFDITWDCVYGDNDKVIIQTIDDNPEIPNYIAGLYKVSDLTPSKEDLLNSVFVMYAEGQGEITVPGNMATEEGMLFEGDGYCQLGYVMVIYNDNTYAPIDNESGGNDFRLFPSAGIYFYGVTYVMHVSRFTGECEEIKKLDAKYLPKTNGDWLENDPSSPNYIENRTHYYKEKGWNIEWDGNAEGRESVFIGGNVNMNFTLVSEDVPPIAEFGDCSLTAVAEGSTVTVPKEMLREEWDKNVANGGITDTFAITPYFIVTTEDNFDLSQFSSSYQVVIPKKGVYFLNMGEEGYVKSLVKESIVEPLPKEFLPSGMVISNISNTPFICLHPDWDSDGGGSYAHEASFMDIMLAVQSNGFVCIYDENRYYTPAGWTNGGEMHENGYQFTSFEFYDGNVTMYYVILHPDGTLTHNSVALGGGGGSNGINMYSEVN